MHPLVLLPIYCVLIILASLGGGYLPIIWRLSHTRLQILMSGVGGFMLGVAVLHLLPHAHMILGRNVGLDQEVFCMLAGIVVMFFLIRVFHVHQHAIVEAEEHSQHVQEKETTGLPVLQTHSHACSHDPHKGHHHAAETDVHDHNFNWVGLALGLSLHTLIDGLALGAAVTAGTSDSLAIFLAVMLHKPLDALSITTTMAAGGWSLRQRHLANICFSLMCPVGALLFYFSAAGLENWQHWIVGSSLAFSAGVFLCVALADILPELSFHSHDRFTLSAALLLGVASAYAIGFLEPTLFHSRPVPAVVNEQ
jgi:zinc and cadmium transporter